MREAAVPSLEAIGRRWHAERYVALVYADAGRTADVMGDLELPVFSAFEGLLGRDVEAGRARTVKRRSARPWRCSRAKRS